MDDVQGCGFTVFRSKLVEKFQSADDEKNFAEFTTMQATQDADSSVTGSIGATMTDVEFGDDVVHDQLPSVEEYKSNMPRGSSISMTKNAKLAADGDIHDQLPSVEDAMASSGLTKRSGGFLQYFFLFLALVVVTLLIVIPLVVIDNEDSQEVEVFTPAESKARLNQAIRHLTDLGISSLEDLTTPGTAQSRAVNWLADDPYQIEIPAELNKHTRFVERYVLAVFYYSTNGPFWTNDVFFLQPIDHCKWYGDFMTLAGDIVRYGVTACEEVDVAENLGGGLLTTEIYLRKCKGGNPSTQSEKLPNLQLNLQHPVL